MEIFDFPTVEQLKMEVANGRFKTFEEALKFYLEECGLLDYKTVDRDNYHEIGRKGVFNRGKRKHSDDFKKKVSDSAKKERLNKNFDSASSVA